MGAYCGVYSSISSQNLAIRISLPPVSDPSVLQIRIPLLTGPTPRNIAVRLIFHTVDLYFGEDQDNVRENLNRGLDMFDRVKADPVFASRIKILRLHWAYEEGDMLDLMTRAGCSHCVLSICCSDSSTYRHFPNRITSVQGTSRIRMDWLPRTTC